MPHRLRPCTPVDVYFDVQSCARLGERTHKVISPLFETRSRAHAALTRLRSERKDKVLSVRKHTTQVEPAEWLADHRSMMRSLSVSFFTAW
jgi:hypothetical protein